MRRISRTINIGVIIQADTISELDIVQSNINYYWEEFIYIKRYLGVFIEKVIEDIKNRVIGASSKINIYINLNRFQAISVFLQRDYILQNMGYSQLLSLSEISKILYSIRSSTIIYSRGNLSFVRIILGYSILYLM